MIDELSLALASDAMKIRLAGIPNGCVALNESIRLCVTLEFLTQAAEYVIADKTRRSKVKGGSVPK